MRFFWSKSRHRGTAKTVGTKLKEQQQTMDSFLIKTYLDDLKAHPQYAREIAREKFGLSEQYEGGLSALPEAPDLLEVLKTANEAKKLLKGELGSEEGGGWLKTFAQSFAEALAPVFSELVASRLPQIQGSQPEAKQLIEGEKPTQKARVKKKEPKAEQKAIGQYIETLFDKQPEQIAFELYQNRDKEGDLRAILWQYCTQNDFDTLVELLNKVPNIPGYEFLQPIVSKLDQKKLALVYDEANAIADSEIAGETAQNSDNEH